MGKGYLMKATLVLLLLALASLSVKAQSKQHDVTPCPIRHWSTTGAACEYAPDLPSPVRVSRTLVRKARPVYTQSSISPIDSLRIFNPDFINRPSSPGVGGPKISPPSR